ncbi:hypothetical protein WDZ92_30965 [Nostoc sp. NIES-2111]
MNQFQGRLKRLEASQPDRRRVVVIEMRHGEEEAAAFERHVARHPEDRRGALHVFLVRFAKQAA